MKLKVEGGKHRVELASGVDYLLTLGGSEVFDIQDGGDPRFKRGGTERLALTGAGGTLTGVWNATAGLTVGGTDVLTAADLAGYANLAENEAITGKWTHNNHLEFADDKELRFGAGDDLKLLWRATGVDHAELKISSDQSNALEVYAGSSGVTKILSVNGGTGQFRFLYDMDIGGNLTPAQLGGVSLGSYWHSGNDGAGGDEADRLVDPAS